MPRMPDHVGRCLGRDDDVEGADVRGRSTAQYDASTVSKVDSSIGISSADDVVPRRRAGCHQSGVQRFRAAALARSHRRGDDGHLHDRGFLPSLLDAPRRSARCDGASARAAEPTVRRADAASASSAVAGRAPTAGASRRAGPSVPRPVVAQRLQALSDSQATSECARSIRLARR